MGKVVRAQRDRLIAVTELVECIEDEEDGVDINRRLDI